MNAANKTSKGGSARDVDASRAVMVRRGSGDVQSFGLLQLLRWTAAQYWSAGNRDMGNRVAATHDSLAVAVYGPTDPYTK